MLLSMTHLAYLMRIFLSFAPKCWELTRGSSLSGIIVYIVLFLQEELGFKSYCLFVPIHLL